MLLEKYENLSMFELSRSGDVCCVKNHVWCVKNQKFILLVAKLGIFRIQQELSKA